VGATNCPPSPPFRLTVKTWVARSFFPFFVVPEIIKSYVVAPVGAAKLIVATPVPSGAAVYSPSVSSKSTTVREQPGNFVSSTWQVHFDLRGQSAVSIEGYRAETGNTTNDGQCSVYLIKRHRLVRSWPTKPAIEHAFAAATRALSDSPDCMTVTNVWMAFRVC
jgi:hypothetical protein